MPEIRYDREETLRLLKNIPDSQIGAKDKVYEFLRLTVDMPMPLTKSYLDTIGQAITSCYSKFFSDDSGSSPLSEEIEEATNVFIDVMDKVIDSYKKQKEIEDTIGNFNSQLEQANIIVDNINDMVLKCSNDFIRSGTLIKLGDSFESINGLFRMIKKKTEIEHNDRFKELKRKKRIYGIRVLKLKRDIVNEYNIRVHYINSMLAKSESFRKVRDGLPELQEINTNNLKSNSNLSLLIDEDTVNKYYDLLMQVFENEGINELDSFSKVDATAKLCSLLDAKEKLSGDLKKKDLDDIKSRVMFVEELFRRYSLPLGDEYKTDLEYIKNTVDEKLRILKSSSVVRDNASSNNNSGNNNNNNGDIVLVNEITLQIKEIQDRYISVLFKHNLGDFEEELVELREKINRSFIDRKISVDTKNSLILRVDELSSDIEWLSERYLLFDYKKSDDKEQFLENILSKLDVNVRSLEMILRRYDGKKVILNPKIKAIMKSRIKKSKRMLKFLNKKLEKDKSIVSEDKHSEMVTKKENLQSRLNDVSTKYEDKSSPLRVISKKVANRLYNNQRKELLHGIGLATLSLLFLPVILPAISYGFNLLAFKSPVLKPVIKGIGKLIGACTPFSFGGDVAGVKLALLKGLTLSGGGIIAIRALIKEIKYFFDKFKESELKQKLSNGVYALRRGGARLGGRV